MRIVFLMAAAWAVPRFAPAEPPACHLADAPEIHGRELAAALPIFQGIPADAFIGAMPIPGSRRIFHPPELIRIAQRFGMAIESAPEICFEWAMEPLSRDSVLSAMRAALNVPDSLIEIVETTSAPAPKGQPVFSLADLGTPSIPDARAVVLWRGDIIYGGGRRYGIWARVRISVPCDRVVAAETLKAGSPLTAGQLRIESGTCFPGKNRVPATVNGLTGLLPVRTIAAGTELHPSFLKAPCDINRGDLVHVVVVSGSARLSLMAKAETAGRSGDLVSLRNPVSNRTFQARVSGAGEALVVTGSVGGN